MSTTPLDQIEAAPELETVVFKRLEPPKETYFYERVVDQFASSDEFAGMVEGEVEKDTIISCTEQEAARFHRPENVGKFKQIGVGDGKTYYKFIVDSGIKPGSRISIAKAREILKGAWQAELEASRGKFKRPVERLVTALGNVPPGALAGLG